MKYFEFWFMHTFELNACRIWIDYIKSLKHLTRPALPTIHFLFTFYDFIIHFAQEKRKQR